MPVISEDEMEIEDHHHVAHVIDQYAADEAELTELSDREEELQHDDDGEVSEEEEPLAKRQRIWPDVNTERAQRYRREVDEIKETFRDEVDEFDMTMVSEYAEDIFEYMQELEVRRLTISSWPSLTFIIGGRHAQCGLHDGSDRD